MSEHMNYIDDIFEQELGGHEIGAGNQGWTAMSSQLDKVGWFQALWSRAWVKAAATLATVALATVLTLWFGLDQLKSEQNQEAELAHQLSIETPQTANESTIICAPNTIAETNPANETNHYFNTTIPEPEDGNVQPEAVSNFEKPNQRLKYSDAKRNDQDAEYLRKEPSVSQVMENSLADYSESKKENLVIDENIGVVDKVELVVNTTDETLLEEDYTYLNDYSFSQLPSVSLKGFVTKAGNIIDQPSFRKSPSPFSRNWNRSMSVWGGPVGIKTNITGDSPEYIGLNDYLQNSILETNAYAYGVGLNFQNKAWYLGTGISILDIEQTEVHQFDIEKYIDYEDYQENFVQVVVNDTLDIIYNNMGGGNIDTVYVIAQNVSMIDSSKWITVSDTLHRNMDSQFKNRYRYLEVPMIAGYNFYQGRFTYILKTGLITGIYQQGSGYSVSNSTLESTYTFEQKQFSKFVFDWYTSLETRYNISGKYYVFGDVYYRRQLVDTHSYLNIRRSMDKYGLRIGAGYYF